MRPVFNLCAAIILAPATHGFAQSGLIEHSLGALQGAAWGVMSQFQTAAASDPVKKTKPEGTAAEQPHFTRVAQLALANGRRTRINFHLARAFGLPEDEGDRLFQQVGIPQEEDGRTRAILVRRRPGTDKIDIILVDTVSKVGAHFFHVSPDGALLKAIYADGSIKPVTPEEAARRFAAELAYWRQWERDNRR